MENTMRAVLGFFLAIGCLTLVGCSDTTVAGGCEPGCSNQTPYSCDDNDKVLLGTPCDEDETCTIGVCVPTSSLDVGDTSEPDTPCTRECGDNTCGSDGCGGSCGECGEDESCADGVCVTGCTPQCQENGCGDDGCGGSCGECGEGGTCTDGVCEPTCTPTCAGVACGADDGCGSPCAAEQGCVEVPPCTVFVSEDAAPIGADGGSWGTAYTYLQDGLDKAGTMLASCATTEIWVAAGLYKASNSGQREATFTLIKNVSLYGGFSGGETSKDQADPATKHSILSGDLAGDDGPNFANYDDNTLTIVTGSKLTATTIVDGFHIVGAYNDDGGRGGGMYLKESNARLNRIWFRYNFAEAQGAYNGGGGLHNLKGSPTLRNIEFLGNRVRLTDTPGAYRGGGGLYNRDGAPILLDVLFQDNVVDNSTKGAYVGGGGVYSKGVSNVDEDSPSFTNVSFIQNVAGDHTHQYSGGGGVLLMDAASAFVNVHFRKNTANGKSRGGGMYLLSSKEGNPAIINGTFNNNTAGNGGGAAYAFNTETQVNVVNSIFYQNSLEGGDTVFTYSAFTPEAFQEGFGNVKILDYPYDSVFGPLFIPKAGSVIHNSGNDGIVTVATDLAGNPRFVGTVDMGAYERQ